MVLARYKQRRLNIAACLAMMMAVGVAQACPIPVFQFALEYWDTDAFRIEIEHEGDFDEDQQAARARLEAAVSGDGEPSNIALSWRDYSRAQIRPAEEKTLPYITVHYPTVSGIRDPLWEGPLSTENVNALLESPLRRQISELLLERPVAVWVLLRSGVGSADRTVRRLLRDELARMERTLKVPDPGVEGIDLGDIYTDIKFQMVEVDRDDPAERFLVKILLGTEPDLHDYAGKPIVFPVYGRGLVMYALVGNGINRRTLNAAGEFLTAPCSCQVKQGNPGVDLLTTIDWAGRVERLTTYAEAPAGAIGAGRFLDRMDEAGEQLREQKDEE